METMMMLRRYVPFLALTGLLACSAQTDKSVRGEDQQQKPGLITEQHNQIAPGKCRIVGTLVAIDSAMEQSGPCSKAPCRAIVRIDSILGYGSAFGSPLALNKQIAIRFGFTLAPTTKELFPNMTNRLPGLEIGSKFQSDLESQNEMRSAGTQSWYLVYDYKRLN